jgi:uncharacterized cupredoxin-like copper-binding protein
MTRIRIALVAALAMLVAVAPAGARPAKVATTTVTVKMKEFKFIFSRSTVPHGSVTFKLVNVGKLAHDIKINGKTSKKIQPGRKGTFTVLFTKKGKYPYLCPIPGHAAAGMKGVLKVT